MSYFLLSFLQADKREDQMSNLQVELQTLKNDKTKDLLAQEIQNLKNEKNAANSRYEKEKETEKNRRQADQDRIKELISEVEKTKSAGEASRGGNSYGGFADLVRSCLPPFTSPLNFFQVWQGIGWEGPESENFQCYK